MVGLRNKGERVPMRGFASDRPRRAGLRSSTMAALIAGTTAGLLLGIAPDAGATVVKALSLYEKVQSSAVVVRGIVERTEPSLMKNGGAVQTVITLRVEEVIKGSAERGERILLRQSGGKVDDFEHHIPGVSKWELGEEVIMFLEPLGPYLIEIGIGIGKYEVTKTRGEKFVSHNPTVALAHFDEKGAMKIVEPAAMTPERLRDFTKRLRAYSKRLHAPTQSKDTIRRPNPPTEMPH